MNRLLLHSAFATAAAVGLQVVLPRLFSVILWYHLGFFAVSLAMLGFALGGVLVRRRGRDAFDLDRLAPLASIATAVAAMVVVRLPIDPTALMASWKDPLLLALTGALLAQPFTLLGTVVCAALDAGRERIGRVYAATFFGGAAGALIALLAMDHLTAPRALGVLTALPLLASGLSAAARGPALAAAVLSIALVAVPDATLPTPSRKHFPIIGDDQVLATEWNAFSRVTFYDNPNRDGLWEMPVDYTGVLPRSVGVAIDAWAITSILKRDGVDTGLRFLDAYPPTLAYAGAPDGFDALVIGAGGGVDVLGALHHGAGHVTAVEINPLIVDAARGRFAEFGGDLYADPRVTAVVAEGRHFSDNDERLYDRIVLSGVDTFAATEAGAYALSENYLYTTEAILSYYARLKEGGVLAMTRWWFTPPRQTLRLVLTAVAAMEEVGVDDVRDRVYVGLTEPGRFNSLFLLKKGTFDAAEVEEIERRASQRGIRTIYAPGRQSHPVYADALRPGGAAEVIAASPYRVDPTTDDRPFFFENSRITRAFQSEGDWIHDRLGGVELLLLTLGVLTVLSLPLLILGRGPPGTSAWRTSLPFLLLGFAYMAVEVPLLQRLALPLGHPTYAVSVVLVALLIGSGIGAFLAERLDEGRAPAAAAGAALLVVAVFLIAYPEFLDAARGASLPGRMLAATLFLAMPAVVMGMPFPLAIRRLGQEREGLVPSAFVMNGLASVLAGPLVVLISMEVGFTGAFLCGAAAYVAAAALLVKRSSAAAGHSTARG